MVQEVVQSLTLSRNVPFGAGARIHFENLYWGAILRVMAPTKPSKNRSKKSAARSTKSASNNSGPFQAGFWKKNWRPAALIGLLPIILYLTTLSFGYVLDDKIVLTENQFVLKGTEGVSEIMSTESFTGFLGEQQNLVVGARYRPLSIATFAIEFELWGLSPGASHFINVLLYALVGLILYRVLFLLVPPGKNTPWYLNLPFVATLLFVLHPVHTEVVANIKGRDEILALLFSLATLYFSFRYLIRKTTAALLLSGACFFLGILAKENTLTFLGVVPLAILLFTKVPRKRLLQVVAPLGVVTVIYLFIRVGVIGYLLDSGNEVTALMNNPFAEASGGEKFATIGYTLLRYLGLSFFPHPLTHDYYPYHIPLMSWGDWQVWLAVVLHIGLLGLAFWQWTRMRVLSFGILFYLGTLFITSNIPFTVGTFMNERFLFMPSVAICIVLAWLLLRKLPQSWSNPSAKWVGVGLLAIFGLGFGVKTVTRLPAWENNTTLNAAAIKVSVNSARANQYYAYSLYEQYIADRGQEGEDKELQRKRLDEAYPYVTKALEIYPGYTDALTCKGGILGGFYALDGKIEPVLDGFYQIATSRQVPFTDTYLNYLNRRGRHQTELVDFYHKVGFEHWWQKQNNAALARKYINMGLQVLPADPRLTADLAQVSG